MSAPRFGVDPEPPSTDDRWRLEIRHRTGYRYRDTVHASYNEARLTPLTTDRQIVLEAASEVSPSASVLRYWDYWGTIVDAFDIHEPHDEMVVVFTSTVETSGPPDVAGVGWEELSGPETRDRFSELLEPTTYTPEIEEVVEAAGALAEARSPTEAVDAAAEWVRGRLHYRKGETTVSTTAADALALRSGVCQDFAHLTLVLLRAMGVPARYTSGYIHPSADAAVGETTTGQSHAWVEAWVGDWYPIDPTHTGRVGVRHVIVARGRDYGDVSPLKGIYRGGQAEELDVDVQIVRLP